MLGLVLGFGCRGSFRSACGGGSGSGDLPGGFYELVIVSGGRHGFHFCLVEISSAIGPGIT
jgi:hypothetical protein